MPTVIIINSLIRKIQISTDTTVHFTVETNQQLGKGRPPITSALNVTRSHEIGLNLCRTNYTFLRAVPTGSKLNHAFKEELLHGVHNGKIMTHTHL